MRHAATAALLLSLAGASVRAQSDSATLDTVQASECRPQSNINDLIFSGCSTVNSPSPGQPWCLLPKTDQRAADVKALCDLDSLPKRTARSPPSGNGVPCLPTTNVSGRDGVVYGCFTTAGVGSELKCDTGANGLQPCFPLNATRTSPGDLSKNTEPGPESGLNKILPGPPTIAGLPKVAVYSIALGLLLVLAAVGLFFIIRRRRSKQKSGEGPPSVLMSYRRPSSMELPAVTSPAALHGMSSNVQPRSSSQYGAGTPMSYVDSAGEVPPNPPQVNVEGSLGKYLVASTYSPTLDDEIVVQPGDVIEIFQEFDDGWCSAVNITRGMTRGVFPMHCIDETQGRLED